MFTKDSLERLREQVDLIEVLGSYVDLKPAGSTYKGLCPFHEEKSPSFMVRRGDSHYHCFGCGAHGDAIAFYMEHLKMGFAEAVEALSDRFGVHMDKTEREEKGPNKKVLRGALKVASDFFHYYLLHSEEGHRALQYLYNRGMDLEFIRLFQLGLAPRDAQVFFSVMNEHKLDPRLLAEVGLLRNNRPFFFNRITFPVKDGMGNIIGFSARTMDDQLKGPKYVNTPETPLFKKSHILFGLSDSRRQIAKEKSAIVVEGQIDALRMIQAGFNTTVAGQGTAFGQWHVKQLIDLGVDRVYLALDGDEAGHNASIKIGDLFQKEGIGVRVVPIPLGSDPDTLLKELGPLAMKQLIERSVEYLSFLIRINAKRIDITSPSGKTQLIEQLTKQIKAWEHPLMVHESLRKLAKLLEVPESLLGIGKAPETPQTFIKKEGRVSDINVDPDLVLETDLLRWLSLDPTLIDLAQNNITPDHFYNPLCRRLYVQLESSEDDLLTLAMQSDDPETKLFISNMIQKKVNKEKSKEGLLATLQKILERHYLDAREQIRRKIESGTLSDEETLLLAKQFDNLNRPDLVV